MSLSNVVKSVKNTLSGSLGSFAGSLVPGAMSLAGGILGQRADRANAQFQADQQREYAQNALQWRVQDAKKAGLHPLAGLSANLPSYSPVYSSGSSGFSDSFGQFGQSVERGIQAVQSRAERQMERRYNGEVRSLDLQYRRKQIQLLDSEISRNYAASADTVARSGLPPARPSTRPARPSVLSSQGDVPDSLRKWFSKGAVGFDKPFPKNSMVYDSRGKVVGILPSSDLKQAFEDSGILVESLPFIESFYKQSRSKITGKPYEGMYWHADAGEFLPYPPRKTRIYYDGPRASGIIERPGEHSSYRWFRDFVTRRDFYRR